MFGSFCELHVAYSHHTCVSCCSVSYKNNNSRHLRLWIILALRTWSPHVQVSFWTLANLRSFLAFFSRSNTTSNFYLSLGTQTWSPHVQVSFRTMANLRSFLAFFSRSNRTSNFYLSLGTQTWSPHVQVSFWTLANLRLFLAFFSPSSRTSKFYLSLGTHTLAHSLHSYNSCNFLRYSLSVTDSAAGTREYILLKHECLNVIYNIFNTVIHKFIFY
jgi:hypothetical protein